MKLIALILSFIISYSVFSQSADTLYPVSIFIEDSYKYGYINREGYLNIKPQYAFAKDFSDGLAFVKNDNNSSKWFCINTAGKVEFELTAVFVKDFNNGVAGYIDSAQERHFINHSGKIIYDPAQDQPVFNGYMSRYFKDEKYGYANIKTDDSLPPIYLRAGYFRQGLAPVFIKFKESDLPDDPNCYNAFINGNGDVLIKTEQKFDENGYLETGYFYSPEQWVGGVCRYYTSKDPKTREAKYIRNDGKIIW